MPRISPATEPVRAEWLRRAQAEYTSAAITQHFGLWLVQIGASPDLIKACLRIVLDEVEHARLSHVAYVNAGGQSAPQLARDRLGLRRVDEAHEPLERDVTRVAVSVFCLGETVAVPLFKTLREECTVPVARRALDRILRDEVRHRDFGWVLLDWLLEQPFAAAVRAVIEGDLPRMLARVAEEYGLTTPGLPESVDPTERAWGLMPPSEYGKIVRRTLARDWVPRFRKRGFDAASAWERGVTSRLRG